MSESHQQFPVVISRLRVEAGKCDKMFNGGHTLSFVNIFVVCIINAEAAAFVAIDDRFCEYYFI